MTKSLVTFALLVVSVALTPTPVSAVTCDGTLQRVALPSPGDSALYQDVAAISASRAWAVGSVTPSGADQDRGIVSRWNGSAWRETGPFAQAARFLPRSIDALTRTSLWVAGRRQLLSGGDDGSMVESFDGTDWSVEGTFPTSGGFLHEVAPVAEDDVWVAGHRNAGGKGRVLLYHFDGDTWTRSRVPSPATSSSLEVLDLEARGPDDVWIVGSFIRSGGQERSLAYRFDGEGWERIPTPNPGDESTILSGVEPVAVDDVWAVGAANGTTLALRWNGVSWIRVASESPGSNDVLNDVAMVGQNDVWAGGSTSEGGFPPSSETLAARFVGSTWNAVTAPDPNGTIVLLGEVDATASGAVYMLGVNLSRAPFMAQRCL